MGYGKAEKVEMEPVVFKYFLSYFYEMEDGYTGFGMTEVIRSRPILSYSDVEGIAKFLVDRKNSKFKAIVIQNWKQLEL